MLKRLLSLVLAMVLLFTAAVPIASAEDLTIDPSLPRNTNEYTLELEPGETKKIEVVYNGMGPADHTRERVVIPAASSANHVATATLETWADNSNEYVKKDYVTITVQAHKPSDTVATITGTTVSEGRSAAIYPSGEIFYDPYYVYRYDDWVVHVTVKKKLNPPEVTYRLVPGNTTKLVTGYPEWLDKFGGLLKPGPGSVLGPILTGNWGGAIAQAVAKLLLLNQLETIRTPRVSPEIYLDVSVYNPNDISLKYQVTLSSAADFSNSTTFSSGGVDTFAEYMQPAATAGTGPLSTSAYASLSLAPGWTRIHHFKLKPHMLYGGGEYTVPFTMLIPWSENDPDVAFGSEGGIQEDFDIHVVSELDAEETYQGMAPYSEIISRVLKVTKFMFESQPINMIMNAPQLPVTE